MVSATASQLRTYVHRFRNEKAARTTPSQPSPMTLRFNDILLFPSRSLLALGFSFSLIHIHTARLLLDQEARTLLFVKIPFQIQLSTDHTTTNRRLSKRQT